MRKKQQTIFRNFLQKLEILEKKRKKLLYQKKEEKFEKLQKFLTQYPHLQKYRKESRLKERKKLLEKFKTIYSEIQPLYKKNIQILKQWIKKHYKKNKRLFQQTSFEIMDKHSKEEVHSNVLAFLFQDSQWGKELILAFTGIEDKTQNFHIIREKYISGKRIDIFIESQEYIIVIENKFNDKLHYVDEERKQTDFYFDEINKSYKKKEKRFIILDYKGTEESKHYQTFSYQYLLNILEQFMQDREEVKENHIFMEYLSLLHRLIHHIGYFHIDDVENETNLTKLNVIKGALQWMN